VEGRENSNVEAMIERVDDFSNVPAWINKEDKDMKEEPKVGQTWSVFGEAAVCEIWGLRAGMAWVHSEHGDNSAINQSLLETMIRDEHGNKPTEDNDEVMFYDVMEDEDIGPVLNVQLAGRNPCSIANVLYREDLHGRTCVGFIYHDDREGYSFSDRPMINNLGYYADSRVAEELVKGYLQKVAFRIPVKAVFKRLEARS